MPVGAPAILGPVSTCSEIVRVVGHLEGSTLEVLQDGVVLGSLASAPGGDAAVAIDRSRLQVGHTLLATQRAVSGERSGPSPKGVAVEQPLNGPVGLPYPTYQCAESFVVTGCSPGATIEIMQSNKVIASGTAVGDIARVFLASGASVSSHRVDVRQILCNGDSRMTNFAEPVPAPTVDGRHLPIPLFVARVQRCQTAVRLDGIVPGARVTLGRGGQTIFDGSVPDSRVNVRLGALEENEELTVLQALPRCELQSAEGKVTVAPLADLTPPRLDGPLCKGPRRIDVSRLEPGAIVKVFADGQELGEWQTAEDHLVIDLAIPANATVTATQALCEKLSPPSRPYALGSGAGRWFLAEDATGGDMKANAFAIHAALMRTGKIVMFSGDQHFDQENIAHVFGPCELLDCETLSLETVDAPLTDVFCCGHAVMPDGRLLVAGGTEHFPKSDGPHADHFPGLADTWIFNPIPDPGENHWRHLAPMRHGRWYPTLLALLDGRVLALSGHPEESSTTPHINSDMEVNDGTRWTFLGDSVDLSAPDFDHFYPRVYVGPSGEVFSATALISQDGQPGTSGRWRPGSGNVDWEHLSPPIKGQWEGRDSYAYPGTLLPMFEQEDPQSSFRFFLLIAGVAVPWIADLGTPTHPIDKPEWEPFGTRRERLHSTLVSLADSDVMLMGGVGKHDDDSTAVKEPELLSWTGNAWGWGSGPRPKAAIPRGYHTTTLLMPDGRVFVAGSNVNGSPGPPAVRRLEVEIFAPWYCCADRPRIIAAPREIDTGQERFEVDVRGGEIARFTLVRGGSSTHSFNPDERHISLIARKGEEGSYWARVPPHPVIVPGWYLLFAVTDYNVPSEAVWIRFP
ncbi:MAG: galactose oxidase-like domain-containing protein [Solirubrobacterales bacterium]